MVGPTVFQDGAFRIVAATTDGIYGKRPHTVQPAASCGAAGLYVRVPEDLLDGMDMSTVAGRKVAGQQFVHEWAKFRYGVFDELGYPGDQLFPSFYFRSEQVDNSLQLQPNFCTNTESIDYHMEDRGGRGACNYDRETGLPDADCLAVAVASAGGGEAPRLQSSVMALPYLEGNNQFCDGETYPHDPFLPNKQNLFCGAQSAFDVIRKHPDMEGFQPGQIVPDRKVIFQHVVAAPATNYLVLLDDSPSMSLDHRLEHLRHALHRWILHDIIDERVNVGLATICDKVTVLRYPAPVQEDNRLEFLDMVDNLSQECAANSSSLAVGLQAALDVLGENNGGVIILLSSRKSHVEADDSGPIPGEEELLRRGVRVVSVLLGAPASSQLFDLAGRTEGLAFYVQDHIGDMALPFQQALAVFQPSVVVAAQTVVLTRVTVNEAAAWESVTVNITVDKSTGKNVVIQLDHSNSSPAANLTVIFLNETFTTTAANSSGLLYKIFSQVPAGIHPLTIISTERLTSLSLLVTSQPSAGAPLITAECWTSHGGGQTAISQRKDWIAVYARVQQGGQPVLGAEVVAQLTSKHADLPQQLLLLDNGAGADRMQDDGIYSR